MKRVSSKKLAELCDVSMIYVQKMEAGDREMTPEIAERIYQSLGFTPDEIRFDTAEMMERVKSLIDSGQEGSDTICFLSYVVVDGVVYFNDVLEQNDSGSSAIAISCRDAITVLSSQNVLFG